MARREKHPFRCTWDQAMPVVQQRTGVYPALPAITPAAVARATRSPIWNPAVARPSPQPGAWAATPRIFLVLAWLN